MVEGRGQLLLHVLDITILIYTLGLLLAIKYKNNKSKNMITHA